MKQILFLCFLAVLVGTVNAQTGPITFDYNAWPASNLNPVLRYNQNAGAASIVIFNVATADQTTLMAASTITGTLNGTQITTTTLADPSYQADIVKSSNTITIRLDLLLAPITANDVITLTFKKANQSLTYNIIYDASTNIPPQLTAAVLQKYRQEKLMLKYVKYDVGYKYRYVKPDDDKATSGKSNVNGKKIQTLTSDQLSDANNHLLDNYTIHIFLDQYGNTLFASTPTGIQQKYHYMLHIIVPNSIADKLHYSISVSSGWLTDVGTSYNSDVAPPNINGAVLKPAVKEGKADGPQTPSDYYEFTYNLFPTTDDLVYSIALKADGYTAANFTKTFTLKKTSFYRGSFDVGVLKTWINNPAYTLVNTPNPAPNNPGNKSVKVTDNGSNVTAAFMYTWYFSFINAIIPEDGNGFRHNAWGRTFLDDDGSIFRKIYPAIGIGLSGNVLNNWFIGLNCQPMQGFGVFAGANIRKINTFDAPGNLNINAVTQDQFNYYSNNKTRTDWAIGIILDTSIFTKIANSISASAK